MDTKNGKQATLAEGSINGKNLSKVEPIIPEPRSKGVSGKPKDKAKESAPSKTHPKKDGGNGKAKPKTDKPKAKDERDQFGFRVGSKASLFAKMIIDSGKTGTTMEDVKKAKWNTNKAPYPATLGKLRKAGRVKMEDGKRIVFVR